MGKKWTRKEIKIAKEIHRSGKTVKSQAHLLPGRTLCAIKFAVRKFNKSTKKRGDTSWVWVAIERELMARPGQTIAEIRSTIGCTQRHASELIRSRHGNGLFVSGWHSYIGHHSERWSVGSEPDAERPPRQSHEERLRLDRLRYHLRAAKKNPFSNMLMQLQGEIHVPAASNERRIYKQDMTGESLEDRRKAA